MAFLESLGIQAPVVQAGMGGGLSRHELAVAVSEAGGLGTIAVNGAAAIERELAAARRLTDRPVAVNVLLPFARRDWFEAAAAADFEDRAARDAAIGDWAEGLEADLIVLAGYMQLLSTPFVQRFRHRVVNIHPALLPAFPGLDAIGQALEAGVDTTGVTVHFVDEGVDTGPAILQRRVAIPADRDRAALEEAVHAVEHELYPEAIRMIARGLVRIDDSDQSVVIVDE